MTAAGRPLWVLGLVGLALPLWVAVRLPAIEQRFAATLAAMAGPAPHRIAAPAAPPAPPPAAIITPVPRQHSVAAAPRPIKRGLGPMAPAAGGRTALQPISKVGSAPAPPAPATSQPSATGFDLATLAYARLGAGDRREADRLFADALAAAPDAAQAAQWARERRRLNQRWSGGAYTLFRDAAAGGAAATPVLGGGQSGASLAFTVDPLARRPLALLGRLYAAHDGQRQIGGTTAQAAIGVRWQPFPGVSVAAERLIAMGSATNGDWNLRVAAGGERRRGRLTVDGYGEAGARGNGDLYAGGQAHAALPLGRLGPVQFTGGPGVWGSVQSGFATVSRFDVGAGVAATLPAGLAARADWRWRVAGNAAPGSGPAVTVSWAF